MDPITLKIELAKVQNIHSSFDENNHLTYIIFLETYRNKLSPQQIEMLEKRILTITHTEACKLHEFVESRDYDLLTTPLLEKTDIHGVKNDDHIASQSY